MATAQTLLTNLMRRIVDTDRNIFDDDDELILYFNDYLREISLEIARWRHKDFGKKSPTLALTAPTHYGALASDFWTIAVNDRKGPRVFNVTDNYNRMVMAAEADIDSWEDEGSSDTGTPTQFYIVGTNLYVHSRPAADTTIKYYYFPLEQITQLTDTIPWNGFFDKAIEMGMMVRLRERQEQVALIQKALYDYDQAKSEAMRRIYGMRGMDVRPAPGHGFGDSRPARLRNRIASEY